MVTELGKSMLVIVAKRGYTGASREVFFHHIRGIKYAMLEKAVLALEREGLINIEWVGPSNFTVNITPKGVEVAKGHQEDVWKKSAEALEKVQSTKHTEKSIMHDDVEYNRMIDDKMLVSEVGSVADEIIKQIDKQILGERAHSANGTAEEDAKVAVAVPAWEDTVSPGEVGVEKDVVERRISGEIKTEVVEEGTVIQVETGEDSTVDRIESDEHSILTKVKERRISGEIDLEGGQDDQKKAPPRPPRDFPGSTEKPVYKEPKEIYSEEEASSAVSVPALENKVSPSEVGGEKDVVEKRISREIKTDNAEEGTQKKAPPRPPRGLIGSTEKPVPDKPRDIYSEEEAEVEAQAEMEAPSAEGTYDEGTHEEAQESVETYDEAPENKPDTMPGFSHEELMVEYEPLPSEKSEDVSSASTDTVCMWELENECPIYKIGDEELTMEQCIICQLIQIKQMLQNR